MGRRGRRTKEMVITAKRRIETLMELAGEQAQNGDIDYSHRYVDHAMKIGMRYNIRIPKRYKGEYCRKCRSYLLPGRTSRVRFTLGKRTMTCLLCGNQRRHPYREEQKRIRRGENGS